MPFSSKIMLPVVWPRFSERVMSEDLVTWMKDEHCHARCQELDARVSIRQKKEKKDGPRTVFC